VDFAEDLLLFLHLVGMAALVGGALAQLGSAVRTVNGAMLYGALAQVATGLLLVGVLEGQDKSVDGAKIAVKFGVALVIAVLCWLNRRKPAVPAGLHGGICLLALADVAVAVFW
jgi:hypothetical protein